ncbi:Txe/YoeB family addiction module toxin [Sphingomonas sp. H39-1-10]|uniref:Txe/YoeB family addiction module toxin n=1 Tax=Sphingomonas TaxID=13687 RepID=UPI00088E5E27|nr:MULTISPECIES: Txe/YoeB family addiction module toxin [Sphingomonas]MDF0488320.1 Txe/YoeB family addiction module toxin [Sphingomonas pollutisoli]SDA36601.1 toxin YoeB [Sphingomonas sp. NFR15]
MRLVFSDLAWEQYQYWINADPKVFEKLNALITECRRSPFKGKGKPEPLRGDLSGWWSRRLTEADRLVYRISGKAPDQQLEIAQCRFHY